MENKEEQALRGDKPTPEEQAHLDEVKRTEPIEARLLTYNGGVQ